MHYDIGGWLRAGALLGGRCRKRWRRNPIRADQQVTDLKARSRASIVFVVSEAFNMPLRSYRTLVTTFGSIVPMNNEHDFFACDMALEQAVSVITTDCVLCLATDPICLIRLWLNEDVKSVVL